MGAHSEREAAILLVEDDPGDVALTREELMAASYPTRLFVAPDGVEAMAFLRREGRHAGAPRPDVVLLDLNLPRMSGREVLAQIRQAADLKDLAVVVLTGSQAERDMLQADDLAANFMNKPVTAQELKTILDSPRDFFATAVKPRKRSRTT